MKTPMDRVQVAVELNYWQRHGVDVSKALEHTERLGFWIAPPAPPASLYSDTREAYRALAKAVPPVPKQVIRDLEAFVDERERQCEALHAEHAAREEKNAQRIKAALDPYRVALGLPLTSTVDDIPSSARELSTSVRALIPEIYETEPLPLLSQLGNFWERRHGSADMQQVFGAVARALELPPETGILVLIKTVGTIAHQLPNDFPYYSDLGLLQHKLGSGLGAVQECGAGLAALRKARQLVEPATEAA